MILYSKSYQPIQVTASTSNGAGQAQNGGGPSGVLRGAISPPPASAAEVPPPVPAADGAALPAPASSQAMAQQVAANAANTVTRPGALTTEWWAIVLGGALSAVLGFIGVPGSAAAQVAAIIAPIVLALVYAYVRAQTKGALAQALKGVFPQATSNPPGNG